MKVVRQIVRGCRDLPHVGPHPGTDILIIFLLMGALAGARGGWWGVLGGASITAVAFVPIYLWGAYSRANDSDRFQAASEGEGNDN